MSKKGIIESRVHYSNSDKLRYSKEYKLRKHLAVRFLAATKFIFLTFVVAFSNCYKILNFNKSKKN